MAEKKRVRKTGLIKVPELLSRVSVTRVMANPEVWGLVRNSAGAYYGNIIGHLLVGRLMMNQSEERALDRAVLLTKAAQPELENQGPGPAITKIYTIIGVSSEEAEALVRSEKEVGKRAVAKAIEAGNFNVHQVI